ncbi:MAG: hypothetical protein HOV83_24010, partial [Catenulispora sp.]|nr:hypothetical protein [Catenulispora sp.]
MAGNQPANLRLVTEDSLVAGPAKALLSASYVGVANGSGIDPTGASDSRAGLMNYLTSRAGKVAIIPPGTSRLNAPIDGDQLPTDLSVICMPGVKFVAG